MKASLPASILALVAGMDRTGPFFTSAEYRGARPKMVADEASDSPLVDGDGDGDTIYSRNAIYVGDCTPSSPFSFPLGSPSGRGAIGAACSVAGTVAVSSGERDVRVDGDFRKDFLGLGRRQGPIDLCGVPFVVADDGAPGGEGSATVSCDGGPTPVVVVLRDDGAGGASASGADVATDPDAAAVLTCGEFGGLHLELEAATAARSTSSLRGESRAAVRRGEDSVAGVMAAGTAKPPVAFERASDTAIDVATGPGASARGGGDDAGFALVHATLDDGRGGTVRRTFVAEAGRCEGAGRRRRLRTDLAVRSSGINEDGDVELRFDLEELLRDRPDEDARLKVHARVGVAAAADVVRRAVDVTAFLSREHPAIVVHGGWVRRALRAADAPSRGGWDVVVEEAAVTDPEAGYRVVARMEDVHFTGVGRGDGDDDDGLRARRRRLLAGTPSAEEVGISDEMRRGRAPPPRARRRDEEARRRGLRAPVPSGPTKGDNGTSSALLSGMDFGAEAAGRCGRLFNDQTCGDGCCSRYGWCGGGADWCEVDYGCQWGCWNWHRKILVHGYCADGVPFPDSHFTDAIKFDYPSRNWSNDVFARQIDQFGEDNKIDGCGIIAHSQGGLAALHLYNHYWSCLDYGVNGGSRMIQSVGSPYQGTPVAWDLGMIGNVFGQGCGPQWDLYNPGATHWLQYMSSWARQKVYYHTTSFYDGIWTDWCSLATDAFLNDPDDGVVEHARGQLSGGNNLGFTQGQCHTASMRDPHQAYDIHRNTNMNNNARY